MARRLVKLVLVALLVGSTLLLTAPSASAACVANSRTVCVAGS